MADGHLYKKIITTGADKDADHIAFYAKATGFFMKIFGATEKAILVDNDAAPGKLLSKNYTPTSGTATTAEEIYHSHQIAASKVASGDLLRVVCRFNMTNNANVKTARMYVNTSNSLVGATLVATSAALASLDSSPFSRLFPCSADTTFALPIAAAAAVIHELANSTTANANITVPSVSAGFWIIITGQKATSGDTLTCGWSFVELKKS